MNKITLYLLNYNYRKYLPKAVESLLEQTDKDFEVILIDNGSSDDSVEYLGSIAEKHGWEFWQLNNLPLGAVGNKVLAASNADYIVRLDADDWLSNEYIKNMKALITREQPALAFGNFYYVDSKDKVFGQHECINRGKSKGDNTHDEPLHGACTLINRKLFLEYGGYYEEFKCQDGFDLYLKLRDEKICLLEDFCFYYRKGHRSLSSNKSRLFDTRIRMVHKRFDEEGINDAKVLYALICDSGYTASNSEVEKVELLANELKLKSPNSDIKVVAGVNDNRELWSQNTEKFSVEQWSREEAEELSSHPMIKRLLSLGQYDFVCLVNLSEGIAPIDYIAHSYKVAQLFNTQGVISGYRFEQSLFRPLNGGVAQVTQEGAIRDIDRWVLHIGGITCVRVECLDDKYPVYSLLEIEEKSLMLIWE